MKYLIMILVIVTIPIFAGTSKYGENIKSTYINFSLGGASNGYGNKFIASLKDNDNVEHSSTFFDLGIYFPMSTHTLLGAAVTVSSDHFSDTYGGDNYIDYTTSIIGISAIYFSSYIEEGFFYRGDFGLTTLNVSYSDHGEDIEKSNDEFGMGGLVGVGYAFPFTWGTVMINLLFSHKMINHSTGSKTLNVSTASFSIGGIF